jgi:regulator of sigma E protease
MLSNLSNILMLAFGFGFVIFWHELGHFLAAKWADVKVEQFAVGFGQAVICWRKGLGFTWGTSHEQFQKRVKDHIASKQTTELQLKEAINPTEAQLSAAAAELGISETEYRLNWIPLGGYVKMLGQDDLKPGQVVSDPRSYNNKTIGQRMVIVSAGVIMNIILAAIGFMYIFTVGFVVPQPKIGMVVPGSPAQSTYKIVEGTHHVTVPLQVGDTILSLNGREMHDFEKIKLNTALMIAGDTVPIKVQHADGTVENLYVTPEKASADSEFPAIGVGEYQLLQGPPRDAKPIPSDGTKILPEYDIIKPGDVITAINGAPVDKDDANGFNKLDAALQAAGGNDVKVTITNDGKSRDVWLKPHFVERFGEEPLNFLGLQMPVRIDLIQAQSPLINKVQPGDVIAKIQEPGTSGGQIDYPTRTEMIKEFNEAGEHGVTLKITVLRGSTLLPPFDAKPTVKLGNGKMGFGIQPSMDEANPIVADVLPDSPAKAAGVRPGSTIISINGTPVTNWFQINNTLKDLKPETPVQLVAKYANVLTTYNIKPLTKQQIDQLAENHLQSYAVASLVPDEYPRKGKNLLDAAYMGGEETRDAILQVYQTVRSMARGSISAKEVSGPVGILAAGYRVAEKGTTRLIWFLSIISANLAVMNFLPIPIVDGGLFTFLLIEKLKGSPISQRTQSIAQAVGLVLLLSVFVFATYQDVARLPMMFK